MTARSGARAVRPRASSAISRAIRDARSRWRATPPPYRGVRGQGRASLRGEGGALLGELLDRYLGGRDSPLARRLLADAADEVAIRVVSTRLASWDYTERMHPRSR